METQSPGPGIDFNLAAAVHRHSQTTPHALAVWFEGQALSYEQLARQAAGLARHLTGSPGWPGEAGERPRVGILVSLSADACVGVLAASWAGATYVPIGLNLPEERILTLLSLCNLSALIVDAQGAKLLSDRVLRAAPKAVYALGAPSSDTSSCAAGVTRLEPASLIRQEAGEPPPTSAHDIAYIIFTSGTTGVPKGVMVPVGGVRNYVQVTTQLLGLEPADRMLQTCQLTFDISVHEMFCTWEAGASLHLLPATRVMGAVAFARQQELTVWNSAASLVGLLRQVKALSPGVLPKLRLTTFGGEQLTRSAVETWSMAAPNSLIYNMYGPTEATVGCLAHRVGQPLLLSPGRDVVTIGQPLPGNEAAVLDATGYPAADGTPGELALAGVQLAQGYLNAPELTAARFVSLHGKRWYLTGDLAVRDASGLFYWLGRMDNQVKLHGHRVELEEVDAHLRQVVDTGLAATVAWPRVDGVAQGLVAFVAAHAIDEMQTLQVLRARLPAYMVPTRVIALEHMPMNANGKVDRKALQHQLEAGAQ